ncbi:MAG TPA: lysylphosphatidylglycerol synthase transmembrane domain-containing protein [Candidatus Binatia bacterium]|nr:lysylphosphatidylglycerol synthase transmembrane domain-containing protein [Candidatus Binatia bacterium]
MPRFARRPSARWVASVLVTVGVVAYILVDVDTGDLVRALTSVQPSLVASAVVLYCIGQLLSAYKWHLLGRSVGFRQPFSEYARFYFIGMFFNLFGPGTIGGDVVRALYLGDGHRPGLAVNSVLFDRVSGLALLMALGAGALLAFPGYNLPWPLTAAIIGGGLALVVGWWMCPRLVRLLPRGNAIRRQVEHELEPFWRDSRLLVRVAAVSLLFHMVQVVVQWVLARAAGADVPFSYCLIYHPLVSVMAALPVSVAGLGVREGGYLYFLTRLDVDDSVAVTVGLLWFAVSVLADLIGGVVFLASGAALPRLRAKPTAPADAAA